MNNLMEKIASGLTSKLKKLKKLETTRIDSQTWNKTERKPEIVDLWHQIRKLARNGSSSYSGHFNFIEAERRGIEFYIYGGHPALGEVIRRRLKELKVKYITEAEEAPYLA